MLDLYSQTAFLTIPLLAFTIFGTANLAYKHRHTILYLLTRFASVFSIGLQLLTIVACAYNVFQILSSYNNRVYLGQETLVHDRALVMWLLVGCAFTSVLAFRLTQAIATGRSVVQPLYKLVPREDFQLFAHDVRGQWLTGHGR